ncbi:MAG: GTPase [candidate division Zixibacteria bacterium]|nr:GTPase [candidate division Zixibacteria bacterium]
MVSINYSSREVCCKIVYYGPGLSGKTTNLQYVHAKVPNTTRGNLISLATEADRTLYFDFLPINIGTINGFAARFQLYTVPGQVYYNATRKLVLRGVDGIVFVADSQPDKMDENIESLMNLEENLREYGYNIDEVPVVIQYNKRDLPGVMPIEELHAKLNSRHWPHFEASAPNGTGVFDTLKMVIKLVLDKAKNSGTSQRQSAISSPAPRMTAEPLERTPYSATPPAADPRTPVYSAAASQGSTPAAVVPAPSAGSFRPYPGSVTQKVQASDSSSPSSTHSPARQDISGAATAQSHGSINDVIVRPNGIVTPPSMAPSNRKRQETKKPGFFKRLFGMK